MLTQRMVLVAILFLLVACKSQSLPQPAQMPPTPELAAMKTAVARSIFATLTAAPPITQSAQVAPSSTVAATSGPASSTVVAVEKATTMPTSLSSLASTSATVPDPTSTLPAVVSATAAGALASVQSQTLNVRAGPSRATRSSRQPGRATICQSSVATSIAHGWKSVYRMGEAAG